MKDIGPVMKKTIPIIVILFVLFLQWKAATFLHLVPVADSLREQEVAICWQTHLDSAVKEAAEKKKPLFLIFEKKDAPWCVKMQKEILEDRGFIQEMKDCCVFARLDADLAENETALFGIQQLPTVVFLDLQKKSASHISYLPFTGKKYAEELKKIIALDVAYLENEKGAFLEGKLEKGSQNPLPLFYAGRFFSSLLIHYAELLEENEHESSHVLEKRREIESLDPHNHLGLHLHLALLEFYSASKRSTSERAIGPLVRYIEHFGKKKKEDLWLLQMTIAQYLFQKKEREKALDFARNAYANAPIAVKTELARSIHYIKFQKDPLSTPELSKRHSAEDPLECPKESAKGE